MYDEVAELPGQGRSSGRGRCSDRFGIEVLATTDDPCDDLAAHAALRADPAWTGRVIPTFRPDRYLEPAAAGLGRRRRAVSGGRRGSTPAATPATWRRWRTGGATSSGHGAVSADHCHIDVGTTRSTCRRRSASTPAARGGRASAAEATRLPPAHAAGDGPDVVRRRPGHDPAPGRAAATTTRRRSTGSARTPATTSRCAVEFTDALRPLLERFGTHPNLHLVLFTVDETAFSREIAPLAGFYPSVYVGAPWWFLDAPDAIRRLPGGGHRDRRLLADQSGFIDDTRAFCSIPARHDMSRRLDAGYLAGLVAEHRLDEDEALRHRPRPGRRTTRDGLQAVSPRRDDAAGCPGRPATAGPPAPIRQVHLGLGSFFRAHQAWYTERGPDRDEWGIAGVHRSQPRAGRQR